MRSPRAAVERLTDPQRRCGRGLPGAVLRIALSLARRRHRALRAPVVSVSGVRVRADLRTPLGLQLYRYGFCPPELTLLRRLLGPGDVLVDGGANIGLFSLIAARAVGPGGRVLACEPAPGTMALLRANVAINGFAWVEPHEVALADRSGSESLAVFEAGSGLSSFAPLDRDGRRVEVAVTTLDELTAEITRPVTVVKLDIEGAEARALRGAADLIRRDRPLFMVEIEPDHLARQGASVADLQAVMGDGGYRAFAMTSAAGLVPLGDDWTPRDPRSPNVVLATDAHRARLAPLLAAVDQAAVADRA